MHMELHKEELYNILSSLYFVKVSKSMNKRRAADVACMRYLYKFLVKMSECKKETYMEDKSKDYFRQIMCQNYNWIQLA
jgi:hypothetical protein